jgi:hypothetical protein
MGGDFRAGTLGHALPTSVDEIFSVQGEKIAEHKGKGEEAIFAPETLERLQDHQMRSVGHCVSL